MSSFIYKILFDKQKPLYYNSITVISYKLLPLLFKVAAGTFCFKKLGSQNRIEF